MEWHSLLVSALGSSPVALISFYWAHRASNEKREALKSCREELVSKDEIIARKDAQIAALQESRLSDLRAVMKVTPEPARLPPKPSGFGR